MMIQVKAKQLLLESKAYMIFRWNQLNLRDQRIVSISIGLVSLLLIVSLIFVPLSKWASKSRKNAMANYNDWVYVSTYAPLAKKLFTTQQSASGSPDKIIPTTASRSDIQITRLQPGSKNMSVWIDEVAYQNLVTWLVKLNDQYALSIKQIKMDATKVSGMVKVFVIFDW